VVAVTLSHYPFQNIDVEHTGDIFRYFFPKRACDGNVIETGAGIKKGFISIGGGYGKILSELSDLLESARRTAARHVNSIMTATYWEMGRRIVEHEQKGERRAGYGEELLKQLGADLSARFGRGFSRRNLQDMRSFYLIYPQARIWQTLSANSEKSAINQIWRTPSAKSDKQDQNKSFRSTFTTSPARFLCRGLIITACCAYAMRMPASSMKRKLFVGVGRNANLTGR